MTNYEKIKQMSVEEMAKVIGECVSSDPCDYCPHNNNEYCNGIPCSGKDNSEIIAEWLNSEVEE